MPIGVVGMNQNVGPLGRQELKARLKLLSRHTFPTRFGTKEYTDVSND